MQPYRVTVLDNNTNSHRVLSAMLSKREIGGYCVYIVEKHFRGCGPENMLQIDEVVKDADADLAHAMSTRRNSTICVRYDIVPLNDPTNRYKYYIRETVRTVHSQVFGTDRTLQDCLRSAMVHYCKTHNLTITKYL